MAGKTYDLVIAGGGLAGGLAALALCERRPDLSVLLIETGDKFGGNHIWSFFESDIDPAHHWLIDPLVSFRWDSYDVRFPKFIRTLQTGYRSILSEQLDRRLREELPADALRTGTKIQSLTPGLVSLENGEDIAAKAILDARGGGDYSMLEYGWQKFAGQMLRLKQPHGLERPIIKDATVDQIDGYRFVYSLPFSDTEIFVEDTYYSNGGKLDVAACHQRIAAYAEAQGWEIEEIERHETGWLPVIYGGDFAQFWRADDGIPARAGARAALVHPVTSYSLPMAVRTAIRVADMNEIDQPALDNMLHDFAANHWQGCRFYHMLCAMMFQAAKPEKRYKTLEHTYRKDEKLIERFYAGKTTKLDQAALLSGKPPVAITKALPIMMKYR